MNGKGAMAINRTFTYEGRTFTSLFTFSSSIKVSGTTSEPLVVRPKQ
jgi:hypothetical protein